MEKSPPILFDRALARKRRDRAAPDFAAHDFLLREAASRVEESLAAITYPFPTIVELGAHSGQLAGLLRNRAGTEHYVQCDLSPAMLARADGLRVAADEEFLPFAQHSVDAVVSIFALHQVNDLPGALKQIWHILKPDGVFIGVMPGAETLRELRQVLGESEIALTGGITPRVAPFIEVREAGALLQRAGFVLPVTDSELLTVTYEHLTGLLRDLRGAANANLLTGRSKNFTARSLFAEASTRYHAQFEDKEKRIPASFELITMTGWKPAAK